MRLRILALVASPGLTLALSSMPMTAQDISLQNGFLAQHSSAAPAAPLRVGETVDMDSIDLVQRPGRYGLGTPPTGSVFALAGNQLMRIDPDSGKIQSILRDVVRPTD